MEREKDGSSLARLGERCVPTCVACDLFPLGLTPLRRELASGVCGLRKSKAGHLDTLLQVIDSLASNYLLTDEYNSVTARH